MSNLQTEAWTSQRLLQWTTEFFKTKNLDAPRLAAEILLAAALGCERIDLYARFNDVPVEPQLGTFRGWVKRHGVGEPVAYLVGHKEFYSLKFNVDSNVLIPRPETEHVVMEALDVAKEHSGAIRIADIGTGSGCIAVTLATQIDDCFVTAVEISTKALEVAQDNVQLHDIAEKVKLLESDLFSKIENDTFDIIVSNPPYIGRSEVGTLDENVRKYEPEMALFGGEHGVELVERLVQESCQHLENGGWLIFEISPMIAEQCVAIVKATGKFQSVEVKKDFAGLQRVVVARANS